MKACARSLLPHSGGKRAGVGGPAVPIDAAFSWRSGCWLLVRCEYAVDDSTVLHVVYLVL